MTTPSTISDDREFEQLADEAFRLLGGQLVRETRCGRGAYGAVWLARETMTRRRVAVKVVRKDDAGAWQREYTGVRHTCQHVRVHPHLLVIHHLAENENFFCYSMEAADNAHTNADTYQPDTLGFRLRRGEPLPLEDVRRLGCQLMEALQSLHDAGLVHRDLKPDNIVFVDGVPKLADIGLVSLIHPELSIIGTPGYIPENQTEPDGISQDIYALGKILYSCLSGCSAKEFPKVPAAVSAQKCFPPLNTAILTACHPKPERRFHNIREFLAAWQAQSPATRLHRSVKIALLCTLSVILGLYLFITWYFSETPKTLGPALSLATFVSTLSGTLVFHETFATENTGLWRITDTENRDAWSFGSRTGLRWNYRADGTNALLVALTGFELPPTADIHIDLNHRGEGGYYNILLYDASDDFILSFDTLRTRFRVELLQRGQLHEGTNTLHVLKKPAHGSRNHFALLYTSPPGNGQPKNELRIRNIAVTVPY